MPADFAASQMNGQAPAKSVNTSAMRPIQLSVDSVSLFRRIQVYERPPPLTSVEAAYEKLQNDASDLQANLYLGWHALNKERMDEAIHRLEQTITIEPNDWIPYYLLGRALMAKGYTREAHYALQHCVYRNEMIPDVWITTGVLFFQINQYRDSLDAIARGIRINVNAWETWYNLGVLYDNCTKQPLDALDALQRALYLNPTLSSARLRIEELKSGDGGKRLMDMVECPLLQISDPIPTYVEDTEIQINPLISDDIDEEWVTESEEEDDRE